MADLRNEHGLRVTAAPVGVPTPHAERIAFQHLEEASESDRLVMERQIARPLRGETLVARRCPHGRPAVIVSVPRGEPVGGTVPPLLWLSCPRAVSSVSRLESTGAAGAFEAKVESDPESLRRFLFEEEEFSCLQRHLLEGAGSRLAGLVGSRGVAGGEKGRVKCLHAHLAYALARGAGSSLVGGWCLEELGEDGTWCERPYEACID